MKGFGKKTDEEVEHTKLSGDFRCAQPFQRVTLRYNGTILPCCTFYAAEMPIGQLKTEINTEFSDIDNIGLLDKSIKSKLVIGTIEEIWKSKQMEFIRDIHKKGEFWKKLQVFRKTGEPCPHCKSPIKRIVVGQRGTHICENKQRLENY